MPDHDEQPQRLTFGGIPVVAPIDQPHPDAIDTTAHELTTPTLDEHPPPTTEHAHPETEHADYVDTDEPYLDRLARRIHRPRRA